MRHGERGEGKWASGNPGETAQKRPGSIVGSSGNRTGLRGSMFA